jgi:hypothetical protein
MDLEPGTSQAIYDYGASSGFGGSDQPSPASMELDAMRTTAIQVFDRFRSKNLRPNCLTQEN